MYITPASCFEQWNRLNQVIVVGIQLPHHGIGTAQGWCVCNQTFIADYYGNRENNIRECDGNLSELLVHIVTAFVS